MAKINSTSARFWPNGLSIVRILLGILIMQHGLVIFSGDKMQHEAEFFGTVAHLPNPLFMAYLAKGMEFSMGLLLILGLFTRIAASILVIVLAVATFAANQGKIFGNGELSFLYLLFFVTFIILGSGRWSLDYILFDRRKPLGRLRKR